MPTTSTLAHKTSGFSHCRGDGLSSFVPQGDKVNSSQPHAGSRPAWVSEPLRPRGTDAGELREQRIDQLFPNIARFLERRTNQ